MPTLHLQTHISAPIETCFDLARSIDLHMISTGNSKEEAIAGTTTGLIGLGESVTWRATHFGVRQTLTSKITEMDAPNYFVDEMQKGIFKSMWHKHSFEKTADGTLMADEFTYTSPLGILGKLADALFLEKYLTNFIKERNGVIKQFAESGKWKEVLKISSETTS